MPNDALTVNTTRLAPAPASVTLTLNADGTFSYTHDGSENFAATASPTTVSDAVGNTDTATVTVTITPVNRTTCRSLTDESFAVSVGGTANEANLDAGISLLVSVTQTSNDPAMR